jgi:hypothetical protein
MADRYELIGAFILAALAYYFLIKMDHAETIIETLKYGFLFLSTTIQMSVVTRRRS